MEILNRKASHNYFIKDKIEAGIELKGTEIKSIRKGSANISESYARIKNNEVFLTNMKKAIYLTMMKDVKENYFFIKKK